MIPDAMMTPIRRAMVKVTAGRTLKPYLAGRIDTADVALSTCPA